MTDYVYAISPPNSFYLPCAYSHRGCVIEIDYLDSGDHISSCPFNDGSVDLDEFFANQVRERKQISKTYERKNDAFQQRKAKYDPAHRNGAEIYSNVSRRGKRPVSVGRVIAVAVAMVLLMWILSNFGLHTPF